MINVLSTNFRRYRRSSSDQEEEDVKGDDVEMMDETIAAMVLTSLSCSPASPQFQGSFTGGDYAIYTPRNFLLLNSCSLD